MTSNGDTSREFTVSGKKVCGLGSFHKTLAHNKFGEVDPAQFQRLVAATEGLAPFSSVPRYSDAAARLTNPQAGLARDRLTQDPTDFEMLPAPKVLSISAAAEMTELYWMALLRDVSLHNFPTDPLATKAAKEIEARFKQAAADSGDAGHLRPGTDVPGSAAALAKITPQNLFRMGLPGEEVGPLLSQFFMRSLGFGPLLELALPFSKRFSKPLIATRKGTSSHVL